MLNIGLLYGGRSGEHDVSRCSAASVASNLDPSKYRVIAVGIDREGRWHVQPRVKILDDPDFGKVLALENCGNWAVTHYENGGKLGVFDRDSGNEVWLDVIFPAVHGTFCEDGTLQGLLELAGVPFVGADVAGSAIGMDKDIAKRLLRDAGVSVTPWETIHRADWSANPVAIREAVEREFGFPVFVKPANTGSSVGIRKVKSVSGLDDAVEFAFRYAVKILVEKGIDCREIECAVIGNRAPEASVLGEIVPRHEFYSYEAKYLDPEGASLVIPAAIDLQVSEQIRMAAITAYNALCCEGMARVDFFLEKKTGRFFLNEINTLPGFTTISMYPKLWAHSGIEYSRLLDRLIDLALERHREKLGVSTAL